MTLRHLTPLSSSVSFICLLTQRVFPVCLLLSSIFYSNNHMRSGERFLAGSLNHSLPSRALSGTLDFTVVIPGTFLESTQKKKKRNKKKMSQEVTSNFTSHLTGPSGATPAKGVNMCRCKLITAISAGGQSHWASETWCSIASLLICPFNLSFSKKKWLKALWAVSQSGTPPPPSLPPVWWNTHSNTHCQQSRGGTGVFMDRL